MTGWFGAFIEHDLVYKEIECQEHSHITFKRRFANVCDNSCLRSLQSSFTEHNFKILNALRFTAALALPAERLVDDRCFALLNS